MRRRYPLPVTRITRYPGIICIYMSTQAKDAYCWMDDLQALLPLIG